MKRDELYARLSRTALLVALVACNPGTPETVAEPSTQGESDPPAAEAPAGPENEGSASADEPTGSETPTEEGSGVAEPTLEPEGAPPPEGQSLTPCGTPPEGMSCVPGGWFERGLTADPHACDQADQPRDGRSSIVPNAQVWLDSFYIDQTEVTNEAYQACVGARECDAAGPLYRDYDAPRQPMTGMDWFQARQFCTSRGLRLPTDAEFELASRGPNGELYPWGTEPPTCERAIIQDETGRACGVPKRGSSPETGRIFEVASRPAGRYGLYDMVGNAEEWVNDWWSEDYEACGEACAGANPRGPCDGADECRGHRYRSIRGGSWYWPAEHAHGAHRRRYEPDNDPPHHFGFRCAIPVVQMPDSP